jgi:general secretion pathway protein F
MARFRVTYLNAQHELRSREVEAQTGGVAAASIELPEHCVISVDAAPAPARALLAPARFPLRLFSQELAVLLDAGIPLLESLVTLREKESAPRVAEALGAVIDALRDGEPLSAGLKRAPQAFTPLFIATLEASERTGQIATALRQQAAYLAWSETLRTRLVAAAIYPAMLIVAGMAVMLFLLLFVVPRFAALLEGFQDDLPWASRALLMLGQAGAAHPVLAVVVAIGVVAAPLLAWRSPALRDSLLRSMWRWPLIGERLRLLELAKLYRTAGMLLGAGVPAVASLLTCAPLMNEGLRAALQRATEAVRTGARLSASLDAEALTTPVSLRMLRVGERSGELGTMFERAAAFYDEELVRLAELVTRVVNPLLMLVMGVMIGAVVVLMYLPIFQLAEQVQ